MPQNPILMIKAPILQTIDVQTSESHHPLKASSSSRSSLPRPGPFLASRKLRALRAVGLEFSFQGFRVFGGAYKGLGNNYLMICRMLLP